VYIVLLACDHAERQQCSVCRRSIAKFERLLAAAKQTVLCAGANAANCETGIAQARPAVVPVELR